LKLALFLTLLRMLLAPVFIAVYLYFPSFPYVLLFLLILCELTDIFDGFAARRFRGVTELGKILDPMADSIVRSSILIAFTQGIVALPVMIVLLFIYRDFMISTLRTLCALKGTALAARPSGKIKAVIQAVVIFGIVFMLILHSHGLIAGEVLQQISFYSVLLAAIYSVGSGLEYAIAHKSAIKQAWVRH
jgi:CDP-diacylglycerol--glycerol-3-phosphate 3-phosphatidyltransferase